MQRHAPDLTGRARAAPLRAPARAPDSAAVPGRIPAVIGRTEGGRLLLDLKAIGPGEDSLLASAVVAAVRPAAPGRTGWQRNGPRSHHRPGIRLVDAALGRAPRLRGWKPQSQEHLGAGDALGITHGLLAVTRVDLADPADALHQAVDRIAATSLGQEPLAVSAITGQGPPQLPGALDRLAGSLPVPDARRAARCATPPPHSR